MANVPLHVRPRLRRLAARIQYDGTDFLGFQRQRCGRTVQGVLEAGLEMLLGHPVTLRAAGRTDAGVHARGQVVSFVTCSAFPADRIHLGLRKFLPGDILVGPFCLTSMEFDPLADACEKTYCYRIWRGVEGNIMLTRFCVALGGPLDFGLMVQESLDFVGKHDFRNFRAKGSGVRTTERRVTKAQWRKEGFPGGEMWEFVVSADGFLYKMVRLMAGTLVDVGRGRFSPGKVREALESEVKVAVGTCLPGKGLCLEEVSFS